MLPLEQTSREGNSRWSWTTLAIIGMCLYFFLWELLLPTDLTSNFIRNWGLTPVRFIDPEYSAYFKLVWPTVLTPMTYIFLHAGWIHLLGNMWMLWIFGSEIEVQWGGKKTLALFFLSGAAAAFLHSLVNHEATAPVIGASGAISGLMGAYLVLNPFAGVRGLAPAGFLPFVMKIPAVIFMGAWCLGQALNGSLAIMGGQGFESVAWWAHVGGFIAGACFAWFSQNNRPPRRTRYYRESFAHYF